MEEERKILSKIKTVPGTRAARAQEAAGSDQALKAQQLEIAKSMMRNEFEKIFPQIKRIDENEEKIKSDAEMAEAEQIRLRELLAERAKNTVRMIADPQNSLLYSTYDERAMYTDAMTLEITKDMRIKLKAESSTVASVSKSLRIHLKAALFGCDVHVGICTDANASEMQFVGENDYTRKEQRGNSTVFECLDQKDLVVQALQRPRTALARKLAMSRGTQALEGSPPGSAAPIADRDGHITSGEAVVYVPLLGKRGGVGCIEIHGLFSDDITDPGRYERKTAALHGMILKQDYRFVHSLRLWRVPSDRLQYLSEEDRAKFNRGDYHLVCGRVTEVVHTRNGVPFVGGAHYAVAWEDGFLEEAVSGAELLKIYAQTPSSLGTNTQLDIKLMTDLLRLGHVTGELLEQQRTKDALSSLRKRLRFPNLGDAETFERTLDTALGVVRGIKQAHLVVWDGVDMEAVELCTRANSGSVGSAATELSFTDVTATSVNSATPMIPETRLEANNRLVEWVVVEVKVPTGFCWRNNNVQRRFFAIMLRLRILSGKSALAEVHIFQDVMQVLSETLEINWQRQLRTKHRAELIKHIEGRLFEWKNLPVQDICHNTTQVAATVLPGADVYSGVLMPGADTVQFMASTPDSQMVDKILKRPAGVSFDVIQGLETVIIDEGDNRKAKYLKEGSLCEVYYGKRAWAGKIVKDRGHEKFDVEFLEVQTYPVEAGVDIRRIVPRHTAFKMATLGGTVRFPFVCIPLRHREKGLGVLGMDGLGDVPRAPFDPQPEYGLQKFLEQLGRILGTTIDLQRKKLSLKALNIVTKNVNSGITEVLQAAREAITDNMYFVETVSCCRVVYTTQEILSRGGPGVDMCLEWGEDNQAAVDRLKTYHPTRSNQKPVQQHGPKNVWILLKLRGMTQLSKGKIYIISITQRIMPISEPDLEFLGVLQKVLKSTLQSIDLKDVAGDTKSKAISEIKQICQRWREYSRDALFGAVTDRVNTVYLSANMYTGRFNAHGKELQFFLASSRSRMKGRRLPRDKKNEKVSIQALDTANRVCINPSMKEATLLHHFGPPEGFEYPFVAIPLLAHIDAPVGILCADACEDPSAGGEDSGDVLSFFGTVGMHLSEPVRGYSRQDAAEQLRQIAHNYPTLRQGMREIKRVILSVVPYALRVAEVVYEPREVRSLATNELLGADARPTTSHEYVFLVRILHAKMQPDAGQIKGPAVHLKWMGQEVYKCNVKKRMDTTPFMISAPRGAVTAHLQLQIILQGTVGGTIKEVSKKSLGLQYLSNVPLYNVEHNLDSAGGTDALVHAGTLTMCSKMFTSGQIVSMCVTSISIRGLAKADDYGLADPFVIVFWNDVELTQTSVQKNNLDPAWLDLNIELRLGSLDVHDCVLALEVWDQDFLGRGDFLGRLELKGSDLSTLFLSGSGNPGDLPLDHATMITSETWMSLGKHPKLPPEAQELVQGRLKMSGTAVLARDLNKDQMIRELDIIGKLQADSTGEDDDEDDAFLAFHECEIRLVAARDLSVPDNDVTLPSAYGIVKLNGEEVGRTAVIAGSRNPEWEDESFTLRCPGGDKLEDFTLSIDIQHVGASKSAETRNVQLGRVEVTGKELVALVASSRFACRWHDIQPVDLEKAGKKKSGNIKSGITPVEKVVTATGYGGRGELLLAGRPTGAPADATPPIDLGRFEISPVATRPLPTNQKDFGILTFSAQANSIIKYHTVVLFNGKQVHRSGSTEESRKWKINRHLSGKEDESARESDVDNDDVGDDNDGREHDEEGEDGSAAEGVLFPVTWSVAQARQALIRRPNNRDLERCLVEVQFWKTSESIDEQATASGTGPDNEEVKTVQIGSVTLTGAELTTLCDAQGMKSKWYRLDLHEDFVGSPDQELFEEVKLIGGPEGGDIEHEGDGRKIWLDIQGAAGLPARSEHSFVQKFGHPALAYDQYSQARFSPLAQVLWNGRLMGETRALRNTCYPVWNDARFLLEPPLLDKLPGIDSLSDCRLQILLFDTGPGHVAINKYGEDHHVHSEFESSRVYLGQVDLHGPALVSFMGSRESETRWLPVLGPERGSSAAEDFARVDYDKACPWGLLKLRGGPVGARDTQVLPSPDTYGDAGDTHLELYVGVRGAKNLAKPDAFSASNPYVVVELDGREIFRTDEIKDSSDPRWDLSEAFFLRVQPLQSILAHNRAKEKGKVRGQRHANPQDNLPAVSLFSESPTQGASVALISGKDGKVEMSVEESDLLKLARMHLVSDQVQGVPSTGLTTRKLVFSVYNHNVIPSQRDEFLGCSVIEGEDKVLQFLTSVLHRKHFPDGHEVTFELGQSSELTPDENEFAQGQLVVRLSGPPLAQLEVELTREAILWVKGLRGIVNTKSFGSGSDTYFRVYRSSQLEGGHDVLLYTSKTVGASLEPDFTDELVNVLVPVSDDVTDQGWVGLMIRIEVWDASTFDFLGCVVLDGPRVYERINKETKSTRPGVDFGAAKPKGGSDTQSRPTGAFDSDMVPLQSLPKSMHAFRQHPNGRRLEVVGGDTAVQGAVELAGGWKSFFDTHYVPAHKSALDSIAAAGGGGVSEAKGGDAADEAEEEEGVDEGATKSFIDESGEACEIHILRALDLPKADGMLGKSDPFCIVRWNGREVGRTGVIPVTLNPVWEDERFQVHLAAAPALAADANGDEGKSEEKSASSPPQSASYIDNPAEISLESRLDIDVWDMDTVGAGDFLGKVTLTGKALADLLDPSKGELELPLSPSEDLSPRGNKLATRGSIVLEGHILSVKREAMIKRHQEEEKLRLQIEANPGLQASKLELHLLSASGLSKVNMRGTADAYFEVYWLEGDADEKSGSVVGAQSKMSSKKKEGKSPGAGSGGAVFTTQVVKGSRNPEYDNEITLLEKPAGKKVSDTNIRIVGYSKGAIKSEYLGEARITGADIIAHLPHPKSGASAEPEPFEVELVKPADVTALNQAKYIGGKVRLTLSQIGAAHTIDDDGRAGGVVVPEGMKEFEVTVLSASNLPKANTFGLSDPYCVLKWARREVGKTSTIQENCDPVWGGRPETFPFLAPDDLGLPVHVKEAASIAEEEKAFNKLKRQYALEGKEKTDEEIRAVIEDRKRVDNTAPPKELLLTVDVFDWNALNSGIFLGSVELRGEELNDFAAGGRHKIQWFDLTRTRRLRRAEQALVAEDVSQIEEDERARLCLKLGPREQRSIGGKAGASGGDGYGARVHLDEGETRLDIEICAAKGLAKADTFGSADPYVKVFWNNCRIGATAVVSNNQSPVWEHEKFYASYFTPPLKLTDCSLYFEVWDSDTTGDGDFLGSLQLHGEHLRLLVESSRYHPRWFQLGRSKHLPKNVQDLVQGELEIRVGDMKMLAKMAENAQKFELEVIAASNLARADGMFGLSDPYAIVKWNYTELGRTSYISKTLNPVWDSSNTFNIICSVDIEEDDDASAGNNGTNGGDTIGALNHLQVDVWDYDMIGNGKFLGCAIITGKDLDDLFKPTYLLDEDKTSTFGLALDPRRENQEGGIAPKGTIEIKLRLPDESSGSLAQSVNLKWESERDVSAGMPTFELDILGVRGLPVTKVLQKKCNPLVVVYWADDKIGQTEAGNSCNYEWKEGKEHFTLKIPLHAEINDTTLRFEVWDSDTMGQGDFLGKATVPFRGLLRMQHGRFTLNLSPVKKNQYVRGSLTFGLATAFPFWDGVYPHAPTRILRKITVLSAKNLPGVNDETPTTKGVVHVSGFVRAKTQVSVKTSSPSWAPAECVVVVDMEKPIDVTVSVYYVDLSAKKEFAIGQYDLPFELLIRPPKVPFDVSLVPPTKPPPKKYKYTIGGTVKIQLLSDATADEAMHPFSYHIAKPEAALLAHDICPISTKKSKQDLLYDGEMLSSLDKFWLGSATDLRHVNTLPSHPEWVVMPIHDVGQRVGFKAVDMIGTTPGHRMALAIQRPLDRLAVSDSVLLGDIWADVDHCIAQLRRKEVYRLLRERALEKFTNFMNTAVKKEDFDVNDVEGYIYDAVQTCCPGVRLYVGRISPDFKHIRYSYYDNDGSMRPFTLFPGMGSEWGFTGRHPPNSSLIKKTSDFAFQRVNTYTPFPNTIFPRVVAPLAAGDVSIGFIGVENFDIQRGRLEDTLTDEGEIVKWLQHVGRVCGETIYSGKEKKALRDMESYALGSGSTRAGVVIEILKSCMGVLQGCRLMEVWTIDKNDKIQSLAAQQPVTMPLPGRRVTVKSITIKVLGGKGLMGHLSDETSEEESNDGNDLVVEFDDEASAKPGEDADEKQDKGEGESEAGTDGQQGGAGDGKDKGVTSKSSPRVFTFLLGIRYDTIEQLHMVKISEHDTRLIVDLDMALVLTFDRNVYITLYQVDRQLQMQRDWYGKCSFTTFDEMSLSTSLNKHKNLMASFDSTLSLAWPEVNEAEMAAETVDIKQLKLFNVSIKRARDLMPVDGDTSDPFCELYYDEKLIGKTKHVDRNLSPQFNERFVVPFTGTKGSLAVDMYDMSMVGKGSFLGRVEIPFDLLLTPPPGEFEYPLRMKKGLAARKQTYVGGMLTLEYELELRKGQTEETAPGAGEDSGEGGDGAGVLEIPQTVWLMKTPAISLTIHSALNLAKANLFGGSSDPFVVVYLDHKSGGKGKKTLADEPIFKTKVIDDNLSPEWEETFIVNLGMNMRPGVTQPTDFPTLRLEIYDYNNVMRGEFLGCCEIGPQTYFTKRHDDFQLGPSPKLSDRKNKLAQGELSVTFILQDNMAANKSNDFRLGKFGTLEGTPYVEVHVLKAKHLAVAKKMKGSSDPYVIVRWNGKDRGETSTKKATVEPAWNDEKFLVNLGEAGFSVPDLTLEVWDRDFFTGGEFLGQVTIPGEELLHPRDTNEQERKLQGRDGQTGVKVKGSLAYKLVSRFERQALSFPPKDYAEIKNASTATFSPIDIRVARDPVEEERRQKFEKTSLPGIISKARSDTNTYLSQPFSRTGIISELHYGQVLSALGRQQHTVLKTDAADIFCLPASRSEVTLTAAEKRALEQEQKMKKKKPGTGSEQEVEPEREDLLYIVARYESGQLPRRDVQFLSKFQSILVNGLKVATKRKQRESDRKTLQTSLEHMREYSKHMANDVIVHGLVEVENGISGVCDMYTLLPDGKTFAECSRSRGDPDISSPKADDFLTLAARLCRHGLMVQFFRGQLTLLDWTWLTTSQLAMVPIESVAEIIDSVEGEGFCYVLQDVAKTHAPDGGCVVPLIGENESMMAMLYVHDLDKLPYSAYRVRRIEDSAAKSRAVKATQEGKAKKRKDYLEVFGPEEGVAHSLRETGKYLGVALLKARLGDAIKKMRTMKVTPDTTLQDILRNAFRVLVVAVPTIRGISIWGVDVRRASRIVKEGKERKKLNFIEQLKKFLGYSGFDDSGDEDGTAAAENGSADSLPPPPRGSEGPSQEASTALAAGDGGGNDVAPHDFPEVVSGYFGSETPDNLLHMHLQVMRGEIKMIEKKTYADLSDEDILSGKKLEIKVEKKKVVTNARRSSAITDSHLMARRKKMLQSMEETLVGHEAVPSIDWEVGVPFSLQQAEEKEGKDASDSDSDDDEEEDADGNFDMYQRKKKQARLEKKEEKKRAKEEAAKARGLQRDVSKFTTADIKNMWKIRQDAMMLVHAECKRCTESLDRRSFRVATGNVLARVGTSVSCEEQFDALFGMKNEEELDQAEEVEEAARKEAEAKALEAALAASSGALGAGAAAASLDRASGSPGLGTMLEEDEEDSDEDDMPVSPRVGPMSLHPAGTSNAPSQTNSKPATASTHAPTHAKATAPLPPGLPPSALPRDGANAAPKKDEGGGSANAFLDDLEDDITAPTLSAKEAFKQAQGAAAAQAAAAVEAKMKKRPKLTYFLSVNSHGIGGEYGYGTLGDAFVELIGEIGEVIEEGLTKVQKAKDKKRREEEEEERKRLEIEEEKRRKEAEAEAERLRKEEERRKRKELNAQFRGESSGDSDGSSTGSNRSGGRRRSVSGRRGSVSQRRASVSNRGKK